MYKIYKDRQTGDYMIQGQTGDYSNRDKVHIVIVQVQVMATYYKQNILHTPHKKMFSIP